jgi:hypothetical protein
MRSYQAVEFGHTLRDTDMLELPVSRTPFTDLSLRSFYPASARNVRNKVLGKAATGPMNTRCLNDPH